MATPERRNRKLQEAHTAHTARARFTQYHTPTDTTRRREWARASAHGGYQTSAALIPARLGCSSSIAQVTLPFASAAEIGAAPDCGCRMSVRAPAARRRRTQAAEPRSTAAWSADQPTLPLAESGGGSGVALASSSSCITREWPPAAASSSGEQPGRPPGTAPAAETTFGVAFAPISEATARCCPSCAANMSRFRPVIGSTLSTAPPAESHAASPSSHSESTSGCLPSGPPSRVISSGGGAERAGTAAAEGGFSAGWGLTGEAARSPPEAAASPFRAGLPPLLAPLPPSVPPSLPLSLPASLTATCLLAAAARLPPRSNTATAAWPPSSASCSAERPPVSRASRLAPARSSALTTPGRPFIAAVSNGVRPSSSLASIAAPASRSASAQPSSPSAAAR
mmetsp:Transcript_35326/g.113563  ORF Transcript_35326/g.113563 Transcript_35326/m.113563 type:complete len:397 (+) Transcript_35326:286-1476(+)